MAGVPSPQSRKRRGCLAGLLQSLVVLVVLAGAGWIALNWALYPWIYLVGDRRRILPLWSGVGAAETPSGRYRIYVSFSPTTSGSRVLPDTRVSGTGYICAPDGTRYSAIVRGGAGARIWRRMDGHAFSLEVYHRPIGWSFSGDYRSWRPRLQFTGAWSGPNLQMSDDGSLKSAFLPSGALNPKAPNWHDKTGAVPVTFVETGWWWPQACPKGGD
jgi:hypothetical protein